ncbi:cytochrome P450 [Leptodontidium sp. 2 PMI_412]|nr:cytochrome P450 [Leptodontidium sp. 2 PMI_412]
MSILSSVQYNIAATVGLLYVVVFIAQTIYSVYFGPLSKFPGPKLAAATLCYEFYYDVVLKGQYTFKIKDLHKEYGPIIRISPYELHVDDPDYYEELYSSHKPRNRYAFFVAQFGLPGSTFSTVDYKFHRGRRAAISPFFSKQNINKLEPMMSHMVEKLCGRIDQCRKAGVIMEMQSVYMCLTTDIITLYAMNRSWNYLDDPDFSPFWVDTMHGVIQTAALAKYFPWILPLTQALPLSLIRAMHPGMAMLFDFQHKVQDDTQKVIDGEYKSSQEQRDLGMDKTIIHALLESNLPEEEKAHSRIWQEGQVVIGAGADTTAATIVITHFHILDNPHVLKKLRLELVAAIPDPLIPAKLSIVERLPYLNAVVQEGLRLSYGALGRLQRSHPFEAMKFHDWEIPAGTPVGMSSYLMHHNEEIFPDSFAFKPERWLEPRPEGAPPLDRYLVAFSKGSRQCVGMNLARAEINLTLATVFRRFDKQQLYETSRLDVDAKYDFLLPQPSMESKGIRVLFE